MGCGPATAGTGVETEGLVFSIASKAEFAVDVVEIDDVRLTIIR